MKNRFRTQVARLALFSLVATATLAAAAAPAMRADDAATPLASTTAPAAAAQPQGNWMVRLRSTYLDMRTSSDPVGGAGASDRIGVNSKWIPEFDVTYFFTPHIATEIVLTIPQKQDVTLDGNRIGTFKHLPPSALLQYHFIPEGRLRPYVGAGVNVTRIWGGDVPNNALKLDRWSVGPVLQIGMDYKLTRNWFLNADVKKVWLATDVKAGGMKVSEVTLDPWMFSVGVGYRF
jgi:outer membrane protein